MKEKKKRVRKLYLLLLLIIFTGMLLSTSTYAWFTVNRIVYIESMNVKVEANGGLEISADAINWKSFLTGEDIELANETYPTNINQIPSKVEPVSTVGELDENGKMKMYLGSVENTYGGGYVLSSSREIEEAGNENGSFVVFDVFIRTNKNNNLYLTDLSGAVYNGMFAAGIENAIRFAFVEEGVMPIDGNIDAIQAMKTTDNSKVHIWEPNYDVHSVFGILNAKDVYGLELDTEGNERVQYDGVASNIRMSNNVFIENANSTNYPNLFKRVNVEYATKSSFEEYPQIFNINSGITKIRVYVWLEGQDVDCENNSAYGNIDFNFQFSTNPS